MHAEASHVVGEVLPLVVDGSGRGGIVTHKITALCGVTIERKVCVALACTRKTVTETGSNGDVLDGLEVGIDRTVDIETAVLVSVVVAHNYRVIGFTAQELGNRIVVAVAIIKQVLAFVHSFQHMGG